MTDAMLEPKNLFRTVMIDERVVLENDLADNVGIIQILADHVYARDLDITKSSTNRDDQKFHLEIGETVNPDGVEDGYANGFYFGEGEVSSDKGPEVLGLAPWWDGYSFKEVIHLDPASIVITEDPDVIADLKCAGAGDWRSAVLMLAAAGIEIVLPSVIVRELNGELLAEVRDKLAAERMEYLAAVAELGGASATKIAKKEYSEILDWATDLIERKVWPKAVKFNRAMRMQDKAFLERLQYTPMLKRLPVIGAKALTGDIIGAGASLFQDITRELVKAAKRPNALPDTHELLYYQLKIIDLAGQKDDKPPLGSKPRLLTKKKRQSSK
jgi:hypothetical protein